MTNGDRSLLISYMTLRRLVGALGMALPVVVLGWGYVLCRCVEPTISDYYALRTRDAFVGILFAISCFMFAYRGYEPTDARAGKLASLCALCVALFPAGGTAFEKTVHFGAAAGLLLVLSFFSLFLFTKSGGAPTPEKLRRNRVYRTCGWLMVLLVASIGLCYLLGARDSGVVFWLESAALWAFGISWAVKGEVVLSDAAPTPVPGAGRPGSH
jgi:hypothetical protein